MSQTEIYTLMAHAQELHKKVDTAISALVKTTQRLEEGVAKAISAAINIEIEKEIEKASKSLLVASENLLKANTMITVNMKVLRFNLAFYPIMIGLLSFLFMAGTMYFVVHWSMDERDKLQAQVDELEYTLQKHAQVIQVKGEKGFWVIIDPKVEPIFLQNGRRAAKLATPK